MFVCHLRPSKPRRGRFVLVTFLRAPACFLMAAALIASARHSATGGEPAEKEGYTLWNPTPHSLLRELSPDRPDKTESPYTVDTGHFQVEMDLVTYARDRNTQAGDTIHADALAVAPVNLKVGLLNNTDFQVILEPYNMLRLKDHASGSVQKMAGFGDVTTRLKMNFWGNDGGATALGMLALAKFPSSQDGMGNNAMEGGLIFPLAVELPHGWDMEAMTEFDVLHDERGSGHHASFINSITFEHRLFGKLSGYAEFYSEVSAEGGSSWIGTVDFGLTYLLKANLQLDAGVNIGVTPSANDVNLFTGFTWRY